jgi:hypothetical protein
MTHHLPSFIGIAPHFKGEMINYGYASDLDDFIIMNPHVTHWVWGHTHFAGEWTIGNTKCLSNPRGYPPSLYSRRGTYWDHFEVKEFEI